MHLAVKGLLTWAAVFLIAKSRGDTGKRYNFWKTHYLPATSTGDYMLQQDHSRQNASERIY